MVAGSSSTMKKRKTLIVSARRILGELGDLCLCVNKQTNNFLEEYNPTASTEQQNYGQTEQQQE